MKSTLLKISLYGQNLLLQSASNVDNDRDTWGSISTWSASCTCDVHFNLQVGERRDSVKMHILPFFLLCILQDFEVSNSSASLHFVFGKAGVS